MTNVETGPDAVIEPVEQKLVALTPGGDDEVLAARTETSEIYLPVKPICTALGVSWTSQYRKIKADDILLESVRTLRLQTRGGVQNLVCMDVEAIPLWLAGIEPTRVRTDLRDKLRAYKRWVRKVVYEAFARETSIVPAVSMDVATVTPDIAALESIARMGEAIATMARQQIAFEQHAEHRFTVLEGAMGEVTGRLDQAAAVVGGLLRRMNAVEGMVTMGQTISDVQASEISTLVRSIAGELAARGGGTNPYQGVFGALYRQFRVSSYHSISAGRFAEVMAWLRQYQETLDTHEDES